MAHARKVIRDAVATILTGLNSSGSNVFPTRIYPVDDNNLPAICIYTLSEDSELTSVQPRKMARRLDLVIEAVAKANDVLDDTLDLIAEEIETAMALDYTLGVGAKDCVLASTKIAMRGEGEKATGSVVLTYSVMYRTLAANATIIS